MHKVNIASIALSLCFLFFGSLIGWLAGEDVVDNEKIEGFFFFLIATPTTILLFQISIYRNATKWLYPQLKFLGSISLTLAWFMIALALPIFWSKVVGIYPKVLTLIIFSSLCVSNIRFSKHSFNKKWAQSGQSAFDKLFKKENALIDWEKIIRSMKHDFDVHIPGLSKNSSNFIAMIAVGILVVGHFIRGSYPALSMLAWAFSFSIGSSWCLQMGAYNFMHAQKVRALEHEYKIRFASI